MSFELIEKGNNDLNKKINEEKPNKNENENTKIEEKNDNLKLNNENIKNFNKKKTDLTLNYNFDLRKEIFNLNKENFKKLYKNKTHSEFENFRNYINSKFFEQRSSIKTSNNSSNFQFDIDGTFRSRDKEKIKNDIYNIKLDIKMIDKELNSLKEQEKEAKNKLIANKLIIEKILKIDENKKDIEEKKIDEKKELNKTEKKEESKRISSNLYLTQLGNVDITKNEPNEYNNLQDLISIERNDENKNNNFDNLKMKYKNESFIKKNKKFNGVKNIKIKNRIKKNYFNRLVFSLKRELSGYDKSIKSTSKLIENKKKEGKVNLFLNINSFVENKNKMLEDLNSKKNMLFGDLNEKNKKICSFILKTKKVIEEHKKIEKLINTNNLLCKMNQKEINFLSNDKENFMKEIKIIEKRNNSTKRRKKENEEKKELENEIQNQKDIFKELTKDIKEIDDINNKENSLKKIIKKNDVNIIKLKNNIKEYEKKILDYSNSLKLYNDYIKIKNEIKKLKKNKSPEKNNENSKINLNNKLNELSNELAEKNNLCQKLNKELDELKKEYSIKSENQKNIENEAQKEEIKIEHENLNLPNNVENEKQINKDEKKIENIQNKDNKEGKKDCLIF